MSDRILGRNVISKSVNSILYEFEWDNMTRPRDVIASTVVEVILMATIKASVNSMIKKSNIDRDLSREISSIVGENMTVRVLFDNRVFSFNAKKVLWISQGVIKLLNREELIGLLLHEIGHGEEKIKILYDHFTKNPKNPKELKRLFCIFGKLLKKRGVVSDWKTMSRVYLLTYILYVDVIGNPYKGLYKWSYSDLAIQYGYWDDYESALYKINKYIKKQEKSKIALEIAKQEVKNPGAFEHIEIKILKSANSDSDNIQNEISKLSKDKPKPAFIRNYLRSLF